MRRRHSDDIGGFSFSMLDILACTLGFLLFVLITLAIVTAHMVQPVAESEIAGKIKTARKQREKLENEYNEVKQIYQQSCEKYIKLSKYWHFWKNWRLYLILLSLSLWLLFLIYQESKNKLRIRYNDYVIGTGPPGGRRHIVHCLPDQLIIEEQGISVPLRDLQSGRQTPFHEFCRSLGHNEQIVLLVHNYGNTTCIAAERIAYQIGVGERTIPIPTEE